MKAGLDLTASIDLPFPAGHVVLVDVHPAFDLAEVSAGDTV